MRVLTDHPARLFRVELVRPKDAIGRHTVTNIQSGMIYGWAGLVDGLVLNCSGHKMACRTAARPALQFVRNRIK